ncbi:MAG: 1-(5-phosphoribosyl)-5-[(5-phosphoribosylamino)methylideneamino]imidazole-4-carboxamide isomerase [Methanothrix sp.]|uniref:1-(5-phosphoribosyl)-5-[(5- phosphoribosylamino)methylideneamino]imidazole-4- carboxamide isomerase n=1 Tax=Methanothrix sp. TaxID=90426 RepID=UPI0025E56AFF|nr:1-(5-phosphoribosyl)-5-[(5-phosphoribosylamino)methylideneamino]imidazole-4-carboxamide isomerase [Methanothrix sp.]MCQ8903033.1 1-(5-phosphoribosyl)-5-[(5-phosphoribosylamino)methylideneamino]imidazole-4-carboxamide isomerase [Methanothrix sp.]
MSFDVFPAVDLRGGRCVQLVQGVPGSEVVSLDDPLGQALRWVEMGADHLHIIDLDGAIEGVRLNAPILKRIVEELDVFVQVGGGIRSRSDVGEILDTGVDRVILGTMALRDPPVVMRLSDEYGPDRIMVALDVRNGRVTSEGWQRTLEFDAIELGIVFESFGAGSILFTNIDTEGQQRGVDPEPTRELVEAVSIPVIAAGGVSSLQDLRLLSGAGAAGAVIGTAIYTGMLDLRAALEFAKTL